MRARRTRPGAGAPQRGLGLLEVMVLTFVVASALLAGYVALRARQPAMAAQSQAAQLAQADRFITGFIAAYNRLPCPDRDQDGMEDCGLGLQKGSLPYRTLGMEGSESAAGVGQLLYLVQVTAVDLTLAASSNNRFEPLAYDDTVTFDEIAKNPAQAYRATLAQNNTGTTADFCQGLFIGAAASVSGTQAVVGGSSENPVAVAYALVHPGARDSDGDGNLFDGLNATTDPVVEWPQHSAWLSGYDDQVLVRHFDTLALSLDCARFVASENSLAVAAEVSAEVASQKASGLQSSLIQAGLDVVAAAVAAWGIKGSVTVMATATTGLSVASAVLAADIASCVVLVGCAGIPEAAAAVAAYTAAEVASAAAIAAYAASVAADLIAFGMVAAAAVEAGMALASTPSIDFSAAIASAQTNVDEATTARANALAALNKANSLADSWGSKVTADRAALRGSANNVVNALNAHATVGTGSYNCTNLAQDALNGPLDSVYNAAVTLAQSEQAAELAKAALDQATNLASTPPASNDDANVQTIAQLQAQLDNTTDAAQRAALQQAIDALKAKPSSNSNSTQVSMVSAQINATTDQINSINAQIANTTDPVQQAALQDQVQSLQKQLVALRAQMATLSPDVAAAQSTYDTAKAQAISAQSGYVSAVNTAYGTYSNLQYRTCNTDSKVAPYTTTYSGYGTVQPGLGTLYGIRSSGNLSGFSYGADGLINNWSDIGGDFFAWRRAVANQQQAQSAYDAASNNLVKAQNTLSTLQSYTANSSTQSGDKNHIFEDAATILKQADQRGAIR